MPIVVPLRSDLPFFDLQAQLDGVTYTLQLRWNERAHDDDDAEGRTGGWFLDILDEQGETLLLAGARLVANFPIGSYVTGRSPPGALVAVDTTGQGRDPGLSDLGDRVKLLYFSRAELGLPVQ